MLSSKPVFFFLVHGEKLMSADLLKFFKYTIRSLNAIHLSYFFPQITILAAKLYKVAQYCSLPYSDIFVPLSINQLPWIFFIEFYFVVLFLIYQGHYQCFFFHLILPNRCVFEPAVSECHKPRHH